MRQLGGHPRRNHSRGITRQWGHRLGHELRIHLKARIQAKKAGKTNACEKCKWVTQ